MVPLPLFAGRVQAMWHSLKPQRKVRGSKNKYSYSASKNIIPSPSYDFFINLDLPVNYSTSWKTLNRNAQVKVLKRGSYITWVGFYKSDVGIRKILIFAKVTDQNSSKIQYGLHFMTVFWPVKLAKIKSFQILTSLLLKPTQGTYKPSFRTFFG